MSRQDLKISFLKRAKLAAALLKIVPFIRMIAINGSLASGKINQGSDIDFFIITEKDHLWTARFFSILILDLFRLRAKGKKHARKICLNHFLTNKNYELKLKNKYNYNQYGKLRLLYNQNNIYKNFINANSWMKRFGKIKKYNLKNKPSCAQKILEFVFKDSELKFKLKQIKKIRNNSFYKQKDSVKSLSNNEFYFYTEVSKKWK